MSDRLLIILLIGAIIALSKVCNAEIPEREATRAIIGEAANQGYEGMLAMACAIRNRGTLRGVYGTSATHIDNEPNYVFEMARRAWRESEKNRIHDGDHWGSIRIDGHWIAKMRQTGYIEVYSIKDHIYFKRGSI